MDFTLSIYLFFLKNAILIFGDQVPIYTYSPPLDTRIYTHNWYLFDSFRGMDIEIKSL